MALGYKKHEIWVSFRVTQLYETGACVYVYFTLAHKGNRPNFVAEYGVVEDAARDEVMLAGGSISHHHGIGKLRKQFIPRTMPQMAINWQNDIKKTIDPDNIFGINNTFAKSVEE